MLICPFAITIFLNYVCYLIGIIGASIGGALALRRLQRAARGIREPGPRRTLSDYRSPIIFWFLFVVLTLTSTTALLFHVVHMPASACVSDDFFPMPWQPEIIYPWVGLLFVVLLYVELMLVRIASVSSPIVPTSIPEVDAVDDMFRSRVIISLQYLVLFMLFLSISSISGIAALPYSWIIMLLYFLRFIALTFLCTEIVAGKRGFGGKLPSAAWKPERSSPEQQ
ncbi:hypothetical protein KSB_50330 [Ktedonobacter robiniae]|uniref:NarG-like domain-containing protein n=1 Tax=Ktedonobacter robiniae TaxID=2778365 RepID=A0ABQ3UV41_9CHLR|nr:hypothetical protein KSB_50330 [Ktedonobacter robiniae]